MMAQTLEDKFELNSRYYDHFRISTLGKGMNPLIHQLYV